MRLAHNALLLSVLLSACVQSTIPEFSTKIPDDHPLTVEQVHHAIEIGLVDEQWQAREISPGVLEATKTHLTQSASVYIAYGYEGFSIEYADSQHMDYNAAADTIDASYKKWVYALYSSIQYQLNQQVSTA